MCPATTSSSGMIPSSTPFIKSMRPRGESISSPQELYVGHAGRQNPQCTQSEISESYVRGPVCLGESASRVSVTSGISGAFQEPP